MHNRSIFRHYYIVRVSFTLKLLTVTTVDLVCGLQWPHLLYTTLYSARHGPFLLKCCGFSSNCTIQCCERAAILRHFNNVNTPTYKENGAVLWLCYDVMASVWCPWPEIMRNCVRYQYCTAISRVLGCLCTGLPCWRQSESHHGTLWKL